MLFEVAILETSAEGKEKLIYGPKAAVAKDIAGARMNAVIEATQEGTVNDENKEAITVLARNFQ